MRGPNKIRVEEGLMKVVYCDDFELGGVRDGQVVDVSEVVQDIPHVGPHDLISRLIEQFEAYRGRLEQAVDASPGVR